MAHLEINKFRQLFHEKWVETWNSWWVLLEFKDPPSGNGDNKWTHYANTEKGFFFILKMGLTSWPRGLDILKLPVSENEKETL